MRSTQDNAAKFITTPYVPQLVNVTLSGAGRAAQEGIACVLSGQDSQDTITDSGHVVIVVLQRRSRSGDSHHTLPPYSVTVLVLRAK